MKFTIRFICFIFMLFLSACSTLEMNNPASSISASADKKPLNNNVQLLKYWQLKGKIAIQMQDNSLSTLVSWQQYNQSYHLSLMSPLGIEILQLYGYPRKVILKTSDGREYVARSPEKLLAQLLGLHLPISYLSYWIRGIAVPQLNVISKAESPDGRLLKQGQWQIQFQRFMQVGELDLPNRLTISSKGFLAKIIIYEWKVR